jgi:thiopurine S-methyltransferase
LEHSFWHHKWEHNDIGFHQKTANALLVAHLPVLGLADGQRVFVPLCGKTLDIRWLLSQEYRVAGAELSRLAVDQLFAELECVPTVVEIGPLLHYSAPSLDIFVGDIFDLTRELLGPVDAVYDRAALVALPPELRDRYTAHLRVITDTAPQIAIVFEYDQSRADGPPFSISDAEIARHYAGSYSPTLLADNAVPNGMRGQCPAAEKVWHLAPKRDLSGR